MKPLRQSQGFPSRFRPSSPPGTPIFVTHFIAFLLLWLYSKFILRVCYRRELYYWLVKSKGRRYMAARRAQQRAQTSGRSPTHCRRPNWEVLICSSLEVLIEVCIQYAYGWIHGLHSDYAYTRRVEGYAYCFVVEAEIKRSGHRGVCKTVLSRLPQSLHTHACI